MAQFWSVRPSYLNLKLRDEAEKDDKFWKTEKKKKKKSWRD